MTTPIEAPPSENFCVFTFRDIGYDDDWMANFLQNCSLQLQDIALTFQKNAESCLHIALLPLHVSYTNRIAGHVQLIYHDVLKGPADRMDDALIEEAYRLFFSKDKGRTASDVVAELEQLRLEHTQFEISRIELLKQTVVSIWSAFEVLSMDTFVRVINKKPQLLSEFLEKKDIKKFFELTGVTQPLLKTSPD